MFGGAGAAVPPASRALADTAAGSLHAADLTEPKREASPEAKAKSSDDSEVGQQCLDLAACPAACSSSGVGCMTITYLARLLPWRCALLRSVALHRNMSRNSLITPLYVYHSASNTH